MAMTGAPNYDGGDLFKQFLERSSELTGFTPAELRATGMARTYFEELTIIVSPELCQQLLDPQMEPGEVMSSARLAPLARNVLRMWYLGQWRELPAAWLQALPDDLQKSHDPLGLDSNRVLSPAAYRAGLVWQAIGSHPMGAKAPGFGTWKLPPGVRP